MILTLSFFEMKPRVQIRYPLIYEHFFMFNALSTYANENKLKCNMSLKIFSQYVGILKTSRESSKKYLSFNNLSLTIILNKIKNKTMKILNSKFSKYIFYILM